MRESLILLHTRMLTPYLDNRSLFTFLTFVLYLADSNVQFPTLDSTSPIIGIVFCLITVRTELGLAFGQSQPSSQGRVHGPSIFGPALGLGSNSNHRHSQYLGSGTGVGDSLDKPHAMRPLAVRITHEVDVQQQEPVSRDSEQKDMGLTGEAMGVVDAWDYRTRDKRSDTQSSV